jgi:hypothetical protein
VAATRNVNGVPFAAFGYVNVVVLPGTLNVSPVGATVTRYATGVPPRVGAVHWTWMSGLAAVAVTPVGMRPGR